ncbi:MAG: AAA family ATPase [Nitrospirae bacterium]|nr:AAA family ATPase [Nitrospirota bacterium]
MYTRHFGLKILPFENVPDPAFFFDQGDYARIRNRITESLKAGRGLIVVTGPVGSGKTTLSQMIISSFSDQIMLIWMSAPPENSVDLFMFIAQELGMNPTASKETFVLRDIRNALRKLKSEGRKCLMIIDESHLMSHDLLNGIRLLNNLEEGPVKLIQILLLGQEELMKTLAGPGMEPFKQRIAALEIIGKMDPGKTRSYISHRIQVAGGGPSIFTDTGWEAIVLASNSAGVPRKINLLCDKSLTVAFEKGKSKVDIDSVSEAADGMELGKEVFHYKLAQREDSRTGDTDAVENAAAEKHAPPAEGPSPEGPAGAGLSGKDKKSSSTQVSGKIPGLSAVAAETGPGDLKIPLLMLSLSIVTLILSIIFYCQKTGC